MAPPGDSGETAVLELQPGRSLKVCDGAAYLRKVMQVTRSEGFRPCKLSALVWLTTGAGGEWAGSAMEDIVFVLPWTSADIYIVGPFRSGLIPQLLASCSLHCQ